MTEDKLIVLQRPNPFEPQATRHEVALVPGRPLAAYLDEFPSKHGPLVAVLDGKLIDPAEYAAIVPHAGSQLVIVPEVAGGGGGKSILRALAMVAIMVLAIAMPALMPAFAAAHAFLMAAIQAGVALGGAMVVNALLPPPTPGGKQSQNYSWDGSAMTAQQGLPIPVQGGTIQRAPNVVDSYLTTTLTQSWLNILLDFGWGPANAISQVKINGNPISNYPGIWMDTRLGHNHQAPLDHFGDIVNSYPQNARLRSADGGFTVTGTGTATQAVEIELSYPKGLWAGPNDDGSYDPWAVWTQVSYREIGALDWTSVLTPRTTAGLPVNELNQAPYWVAVTSQWSPNATNTLYVLAVSYGVADHKVGQVYKATIAVPVYDAAGDSIGTRDIAVSGTWQINPQGPGAQSTAEPGVNYVVVTDYTSVTHYSRWNKTLPCRDVVRIDNLPPARYEYLIEKLGANHGTDPQFFGLLPPIRTDTEDVTRRGEETWLTTVREIEHQTLSYPNRILLGLRALATDKLSGGNLNISAVVTMGATAAMGYKNEVAYDLPEAYFRMNDSGATCVDLTGHGHDGSYSGSPVTAIQGEPGLVIASPDAAVKLGTSDSISLGTEVGFPAADPQPDGSGSGWALDVWCKPDVLPWSLVSSADGSSYVRIESDGQVNFHHGGADHLSGVTLDSSREAHHVALGAVPVGVLATAPGPVAPPVSVPAGQAVVWALPTTAVSGDDAGAGDHSADNGSASATVAGGELTFTLGEPLGNYHWFAQWEGFTAPSLPPGAVVEAIYGVLQMSRTNVVGAAFLECRAGGGCGISFAGVTGDAAFDGLPGTFASTVFHTASLGTDLTQLPTYSVLAALVRSLSSLSEPLDDDVVVTFAGFAIYYSLTGTGATPGFFFLVDGQPSFSSLPAPAWSAAQLGGGGGAGTLDEVALYTYAVQPGRLKQHWLTGINGIHSVLEDRAPSNPAMIAIDQLVNPLYGGQQSPRLLDVPAFTKACDFNDELVSDGEGGQLYRHIFNGVFDKNESLWSALGRVGAMSRTVFMRTGSQYTCVCEAPVTRSQLFTMGNIKLDSFKVSYPGLMDRANTVSGTYLDETNSYKQTPIRVMDEPAIAAGAPINDAATVDLFGITNPRAAWRELMYRLLASKAALPMAQIDCALEGIAARIGDVIGLQHDVPQWGAGGRILSVAVSSGVMVIKLDQQVTIASGPSYVLMLVFPTVLRGSGTILSHAPGLVVVSSTWDGSTPVKRLVSGGQDINITSYAASSGTAYLTVEGLPPVTDGAACQLYDVDAIETRTVSNAPGTTDTIAVSSAFPGTPDAYTLYFFGELSDVQDFRIAAVGRRSDQEMTLQLVKYDADLYGDLEPLLPAAPVNADEIAVTNLVVVEAPSATPAQPMVAVSWQPGVRTAGARVYLTRSGLPEYLAADVPSASGSAVQIAVFSGYTYLVRVVGYDSQGFAAPYASAPTASITIGGSTVLPADVAGFQVVSCRAGSGSVLPSVTLAWTDNPYTSSGGVNVDHYEIRYGAAWATATQLTPNPTVSATTATYVSGPGTYWVAAVNAAGQYSAHPASANAVVLPQLFLFNGA